MITGTLHVHAVAACIGCLMLLAGCFLSRIPWLVCSASLPVLPSPVPVSPEPTMISIPSGRVGAIARYLLTAADCHEYLLGSLNVHEKPPPAGEGRTDNGEMR